MSEPESSVPIQQVIVAFDTSLRALNALELAAALAARRQANLEALFVEDVNLFTLAGLPFARELDTASGAERALNRPQIASSLRTHQQRVRKALEEAGKRRRLRTTVRVRRGHYVSEALEAATGADVLFLSSVSRLTFGGGMPARRQPSKAPVWVVYDGTQAAAKALRLGAELSEVNAAPLAIVLLAEGDGEIERLNNEVNSMLAQEAPAPMLPVSPADFGKLSRTLAESGCSLLVFPRERSPLIADPSRGYLEALDCPLVVVS